MARLCVLGTNCGPEFNSYEEFFAIVPEHTDRKLSI